MAYWTALVNLRTAHLQTSAKRSWNEVATSSGVHKTSRFCHTDVFQVGEKVAVHTIRISSFSSSHRYHHELYRPSLHATDPIRWGGYIRNTPNFVFGYGAFFTDSAKDRPRT
jgi:hypothetical protein